MDRLKAVYVLARESFDLVFGPAEVREIASLVDVIDVPMTRETLGEHAHALAKAQVLLTGWGAPVVDDALLEMMPNLRLILYAAGAAGWVATPMAHDRGILVSSAYAANAVPVAEYALSTIIFSLKHGWRLSREYSAARQLVPRDMAPGCYGRTVGLISMGMIARTLVKLLRPLDLQVLAYDPFLSQQEACDLGVKLVSLDEIFRRSEVVSLHTPSLPETCGLIRGRHFALMRKGATFINTARGEIVEEEEMVQVLRERPDLHAVLDVLCEELGAPVTPLFDMPNVTVTPHIAGSAGQECQRMAQYMIDELKRYLAGESLRWQITPELAARSTHRSHVVRKPSRCESAEIK